MRLSSVKFHILHNACGWHPNQHIEDTAAPSRPATGQRWSAPASATALHPCEKRQSGADNAVSSLSLCHAGTQVLALEIPLQQEEDRPRAAYPSGPYAEVPTVAEAAQDAPHSGPKADHVVDQAGTHVAHVAAEAGVQDEHATNGLTRPESTLPPSHQTDAELQHCSVWAAFQHRTEQAKLEISDIVRTWKDRLAQHCCVCNNWALDKNSVKCHLIRMHAQEWYRVAEKVATACRAHKHLFTRDAACQLCLKQVYGVERHALQCPVLFQACFMSCLAIAPPAPLNLWHKLRSLTRDACAEYLQGLAPVAQEATEALSQYCALRARDDIETPIMDLQAWRKHLQQAHGVTKEVLNVRFHEQAALINISRPCPFCRLPFQKSPKLHRAKCLPLAQLLSVKHGYAGDGGIPDSGTVGTGLTNEGVVRLNATSSQGHRREDEASEIPKAGQGTWQSVADRKETPGSSGRRRNGRTSSGVTDGAENNPHLAGTARSGAQPACGRSYLRAVFLNHGHVDPDHAPEDDEPLAGAVRAGEVYNHTPGSTAHESVDGAGRQAGKVREGHGSHAGDEGPGTFPGCPTSLGLHSMESTGEESTSHGPAASVLGRVEGRDQDTTSSCNDRGRHPQVCTNAKAGRKHLGAGCGVHLGADNQTQSGESPCGDDQTGQLSGIVADRPSPPPGEASAQSASQGTGGDAAVSSSGTPHCWGHTALSKDVSHTSPIGASACVPSSSDDTGECARTMTLTKAG